MRDSNSHTHASHASEMSEILYTTWQLLCIYLLQVTNYYDSTHSDVLKETCQFAGLEKASAAVGFLGEAPTKIYKFHQFTKRLSNENTEVQLENLQRAKEIGVNIAFNHCPEYPV